MNSILAQASPPGATQTVANLFNRHDALAHPEDLVNNLQQVPMVMASVLVAVGLICMMWGFKFYKIVVILTALITGITLGFQFGQAVQREVIVAGCMGVLLAVVAWPLMKYAVALSGGLAGAFIGASIYTGLAMEMAKHGQSFNPQMSWVGALCGLMFFGLMSFILFELSVVMFTSMSGAVMFMLGVVALLMNVDAFRPAIESSLNQTPWFMPMLVMVAAVVGVVLQQQFDAFAPPKKTGASTKAKTAEA
ncbi:MAG: TM7S3/TM198-like domain-containing protein [Planctomycetota bacterium]|jgi:hypothetical protein